MIQSMTAFARQQIQNETTGIVCEIRSINHRFLEISVYLPEALRVLEMLIRERIKQKLKRGKIECSIRYQNNNAQIDNHHLKINASLADELCKASEKISEYLISPAPVNPTDILRFPGVLETKELNADALKQDLMTLVDHTLEEIIQSRKREGDALAQLLIKRSDHLSEELKKVKTRLPQVLIDQDERLRKRFKDASIELDPSRLEQEMVLFTQKIDISEEIERAETHIKEIRRVLDEGGMIGRRLDFLLQELNREANTLGSKSVDKALTHSAVEMKVVIEQIREQIQNIE